MLDADQRNVKKYEKFRGQIYFLPGQLPPEQEVIRAITQHQDEFARRLAANTVTLKSAMRRCQGYDHHDYFEELSKQLYGDEVNAKVYECAIVVWFANYHDRNEVHDLMKSIDAQLGAEDINSVDELYPPVAVSTAKATTAAKSTNAETKGGFGLKQLFRWRRVNGG